MKKEIFEFIIVFALLMPFAFSYTLEDYPMMFVKNDAANIRFVLGKNAMIYDGIALATIISSLQQFYTEHNIQFTYSFSLDADIDSVYDVPSIVIGGPCANAAASELFEYPLNCRNGFIPGHGMIKLFESNNPVLFVGGYFWQDTLNAAYALSNWKKYNMKGITLDVTTEIIPQLIVK